MYRSLNIVRAIKSRKLRWTEHVVRMEESRIAFKLLAGNPLGRPRRRYEDINKMDLIEIGIGIGMIRLRIGIIGEPL